MLQLSAPGAAECYKNLLLLVQLYDLLFRQGVSYPFLQGGQRQHRLHVLLFDRAHLDELALKAAAAPPRILCRLSQKQPAPQGPG